MSATQAQLNAVYDLENIIPASVVAAVCVPLGIVSATYASAHDFQIARPRTEVLFHLGSEVVPRIGVPVQNYFLNAAYKGTLVCTTITDAEDGLRSVHSNVLSLLRWNIPQLGNLVNGTVNLPNHKLQFQRETGTTYLVKNDEGYWTSTITFDFDVSIQPSAIITIANA
jgi:hypothetical protein